MVRDGDNREGDCRGGTLAAGQIARVDSGVSADGNLQFLGMRVTEAEGALADLGLSGGIFEAVESDSPADKPASDPVIF